MRSEVIRARVSSDTMRAVKAVAEAYNWRMPDGRANLSAAVRHLVEIGLQTREQESERCTKQEQT